MGNNLDNKPLLINQHQISSPHLMLNNCKMYILQNKKKLKASWPFIEKQVYQDWVQKYDHHLHKLFATANQASIKQNPISRLIFLPEQYQFVHLSYCSSNGMVNMQYQMIEDSLVDSIEKRSINNQPFTQNQIWAVLFYLVKIGDYYHQRSMAIGDIRPENIFLSENSHYLKIATEHSWLQGKSMQQKYNEKEKMFLTKDMMSIFEENKPYEKRIGFSNDSFAIGMTIAQCVLLEDLSIIYEIGKEKTRIIEERHSSIIDKLLKIKYYPLKLIMIIVGMIQLQGKARFEVSEVMNLLDNFKKQIFNQSPISISRSHFKQYFGFKYDSLQQILSNFKTNHSNQLFINRELSLSNAYTINGLSTVQMVKRTYDETFNIQLLDLSVPTRYRTSQVSGNQNGDQRILGYSQQAKKSNVLQQFYITSDAKPKSPLRTGERSKRKPSPLKIDENLVQSEVKRIIFTPEKDRSVRNFSPITHKNQTTDIKNLYLGSPQLKIFEGTKDSAQQNFSFHSPQLKTEQIQRNLFNKKLDLHKLAKYTESQQAMKIPDNLSESFIIENKVSNSPQSYVTYQYSKSKTNSINYDFNKQGEVQRMTLDFPPSQLKKKTSEFTQMERQSFPLRLNARKRMTLNHNGYYKPQISNQI